MIKVVTSIPSVSCAEAASYTTIATRHVVYTTEEFLEYKAVHSKVKVNYKLNKKTIFFIITQEI